MQSVVAHLKKEWKVYVMALWMIGVSGFLYYLNGQVQSLQQRSLKLGSDMDAIEGVLISTDGNVQAIKKQVDDMSARVAVIHKRIMRRR
jgi:hypothetical protein